MRPDSFSPHQLEQLITHRLLLKPNETTNKPDCASSFGGFCEPMYEDFPCTMLYQTRRTLRYSVSLFCPGSYDFSYRSCEVRLDFTLLGPCELDRTAQTRGAARSYTPSSSFCNTKNSRTACVRAITQPGEKSFIASPLIQITVSTVRGCTACQASYFCRTFVRTLPLDSRATGSTRLCCNSRADYLG